MLFIVGGAHRKRPEAFIVPKATNKYTISFLSSLFSRYGYLISLVSGNDPQPTFKEVKVFLSNHSVKDTLNPP